MTQTKTPAPEKRCGLQTSELWLAAVIAYAIIDIAAASTSVVAQGLCAVALAMIAVTFIGARVWSKVRLAEMKFIDDAAREERENDRKEPSS